MSNRRIDFLEKEFKSRGTTIMLNGDGSTFVYTVIKLDGFFGVGEAYCNTCDEYNFNQGSAIARRRALKHIYEQRKRRWNRAIS